LQGPPPVELAAPAGGATLVAGSTAMIEWAPLARWRELGKVDEWEAFLSLDGGATYPVRLTPHLGLAARSSGPVAPRCALNWPYSTFRRHLGMNTTWYLHSQAVWLKLSYLSIVVSSPLVRLAAHEGKVPRWAPPEMSNFYCHPAEPGGLPW
jgi:hypothetical protein